MTKTRYFYRRESERVFTVAYTHDRETGETSYGASVFRQDRPSETFVKASHRETASNRLKKCPVRLKVFAGHPSEVEDAIRQSIRTVGVRGDRVV